MNSPCAVSALRSDCSARTTSRLGVDAFWKGCSTTRKRKHVNERKERIMSTETYVTKLPKCNYPHPEGPVDALYDAKTDEGPWAYLCEAHFQHNSVGRLGTGYGQRLIVGDKPVDTGERKRRKIREAVEAGDFDRAEELIGDGDPADFF
jgi:hypothetical protein